MEVKIILPETMDVALRSGSTHVVDLAQLSADILSRALLMGLGQKVRNYAASALLNCKTAAAGPKANDETDAAYAKRVEKVTVSTETLQAEQDSCIAAGIARLYAGDWGAERGTAGPGIDKGFADFVIGKFGAALPKLIPGFAQMKTTAAREAVWKWMDESGQRDKLAGMWEQEKAEAAKAAADLLAMLA